ncbi:hypothetical protein FDP41_012142 [Naegleria fowleri]|uniref:Uncharacterized protein n=1 Tax=Naegleria fowleri TaxID=5763 RepID=A0A6A5C7Q0_NAEFO|nr:uncharacterized protein FDP41_012142 [Naegleria fowleri]KAF0981485.1 hypothetical protein FDP41_012142 [Naegleria fowleri]
MLQQQGHDDAEQSHVQDHHDDQSSSPNAMSTVEIALINSLMDQYSIPMMNDSSCSMEEQKKRLKMELTKLLRSEPYPLMTMKYLQFVEALEKSHLKSIAIEFIVKLCGNSEVENDKIITTLERVYDRCNDLARIVINTLYKLDNLTEKQQNRILLICQSALESAEEEHLDDIVKIMLKNMTKRNAHHVVHYIRNKLSYDDFAAARICSEILSETFSTNPSSAAYFLKSLKSEEKEFSKLDILILIVLLSTRSRERSATFSIFKNAFQNKPKRLISLTTILDALKEASSIVNEKFSNSIYVFILYLLSNSELFTYETGVSWAYSIFISAFKAHPLLRSKFLSSLMAMFQYSNDSRSSIASDILVGLCDDTNDTGDNEEDQTSSLCKEMATDYLSILKEALSHGVTYSIKCQHSLCYVLAKCCTYEPRLFEFLMIFIRKQLFSGQDKKSQLGLIISAHIIHETQLMSSMDVERFVFTLFNQKLCDENTIFVLDLLIYNIEKLYMMGFNARMKHMIASLINNYEIVKDILSFENKKSFNFRKFASGSELNKTRLKTLSLLFKCLVMTYEKEHPQENLALAIMQYGVVGSSKEELVCAYVVFTTMCELCIENCGTLFDEKTEDALNDSMNYLLTLRYDIPIAKSIGIFKMNLDDLYELFPMDLDIVCNHVRTLNASTEYGEDDEKAMYKEREAFRCLFSDTNATLKYLLISKATDPISDTHDTLNNSSGATKGKQAFSPEFKCISPVKRFNFGALLENSRRQPVSISDFIESKTKTLAKLVKMTFSFSNRMTTIRSQITKEIDTEFSRKLIDHYALCISYIYSTLTNVLHATKRMNEETFEKLLILLKRNNTDLACSLQYLPRLFLNQIEKSPFFVHITQLCLLFLALSEGKNLQTCIGYVGLSMMQTVYSSLSISAEIEKLIFDTFIFKELPFYHLLFHRESKQQTSHNKYLMQARLLIPLAYLPADEGRFLIDYFLMALNNFVLGIINGEGKSQENFETERIQHGVVKVLDEHSFHLFFQIVTKVAELALTNAPVSPVHSSNGKFFIRIEEPLAFMRKIIMIFNLVLECKELKKMRNNSGELLAHSLLSILPKLHEKITESLKYLSEKRDEIEFELRRSDYIPLIESMKLLCDSCFSLCDRQKRFMNPNSTQDGKLRQVMLKLFQKQHELEIFLRDICESHYIDFFTKELDDAMIDDEYEHETLSNSTVFWEFSSRSTHTLEEKIKYLTKYNMIHQVITEDETILTLWDQTPPQTFFDKNILFLHPDLDGEVDMLLLDDEEDLEESGSDDDDEHLNYSNVPTLEQALMEVTRRKEAAQLLQQQQQQQQQQQMDENPSSDVNAEIHILQPRKKTKF